MAMLSRCCTSRNGNGAVKPRDGPGGRQRPVGSFDVSTVRQRSAPNAVNGGCAPSAVDKSGVYWLIQKPLRSGVAAAACARASRAGRLRAPTPSAAHNTRRETRDAVKRVSVCRSGGIRLRLAWRPPRRVGAPVLLAAEEIPAVGENRGTHVGQVRAVAREVAVDGDDVAELDRVLAPSGAIERIRRPAFDRPLRYHAGPVLTVPVTADMLLHLMH